MMLTRHWRWVLAVVAVIALGLVLEPVFRPGGRSRPGVDLPWQIHRRGDTVEIFGLTLGETTLAQAIDKLGQRHEVALFRALDGHLDLEAYFRAVSLGGLSARMVLNLDLPRDTLRDLLPDNAPGQPMPSGSRRFALPEVPPPVVARAPIRAVTYVPVVDFDPELVDRHFGQPGERLDGPEDIRHWLYPELGLAISWEGEQTVFHYVRPPMFSRLRARLLEATDVTADANAISDDATPEYS